MSTTDWAYAFLEQMAGHSMDFTFRAPDIPEEVCDICEVMPIEHFAMLPSCRPNNVEATEEERLLLLCSLCMHSFNVNMDLDRA